MGFFSESGRAKSGATTVAVATPFDARWFAGWWQDITDVAGVDPGDERGQAELIWFTLHCLDDTARQTFTQMGQPEAYASFQAQLEQSRTPEMMVALLVGWNSDMLQVIEQRLQKFRLLMMEGGQKNGHFRFGMLGLEE